MEKDLFDYSGWEGDQECMIFYDPVLKVPIGEFEVGHSFRSAAIIQCHPVDCESYLEFYNDDAVPVAKFLIGIKIVGQVAIN